MGILVPVVFNNLFTYIWVFHCTLYTILVIYLTLRIEAYGIHNREPILQPAQTRSIEGRDAWGEIVEIKFAEHHSVTATAASNNSCASESVLGLLAHIAVEGRKK